MSSTQSYMQRLENTEWLRMFKMFLAINEKAERAAQQTEFFKRTNDAEFAFVFNWLEGNGFTKTQLVLEVESFRRMDTKAFDYTKYVPDIFFKQSKSPGTDSRSQGIRQKENDDEALGTTQLGVLLNLVPKLICDDIRAELLTTNARLNADLTVYESQIEELQHKLNSQMEDARQLRSTLSKYKTKHNELMAECKTRLAAKKEELLAKDGELNAAMKELAAAKARLNEVSPVAAGSIDMRQPTTQVSTPGSLKLSGSLSTNSPIPAADSAHFDRPSASQLTMQTIDRHNIVLGVDTSMCTSAEPLPASCSQGIQVYVDTDEVFLATQELRIRTQQLQTDLEAQVMAKEEIEREKRDLLSQISEAQDQITRLQLELQRANTRHNEDTVLAVNESLAQAKATHARLTAELTEANESVAIYSHKLKDKEAQLLQASSELGTLKGQLATLTATSESLQKEITQVLEQYTLLKRQYEESQARAMKYESNNTFLEQEQTRWAEKHEQLRLESAQQIQILKRELQTQNESFTAARESNLKLQKEHEKLILEHNSMTNKLGLIETQLKQTLQEHEKQTSERKELLNALASEEEKTRRLENTYDTLKGQYTEVYNYSLSLSDTNQKLTEELQQLRRTEIEGRDARTDLEKKLSQSADLARERLEQIKERDRVIGEQNKNIDDLSQAIKALEQEKARVSDAFEAFKTSDEAITAQMTKKRLIEMELEVSSLQQKYDKLEHEYKTEVSLLTTKNADLKASYEAIKAKSAELSATLKRTTEERAEAIKAHLQVKEELDAKLEALQNHQSDINELTKTTIRLQSTISTLQDDLAIARRDNVEKMSRIGELELNALKLENKDAELATLNNTVATYKSTIQSLQDRLNRMEIDANIQQQAYFNLEQQLSAFSESREDQTNAITKLQERNKQIATALSNIHKKYESLTATHEEILKQYRALEAERATAVKDRDFKDNTIQEMSAVVQQKDAELKALLDKLSAAEEAVRLHEAKATEEMQMQSEEYLVLKMQYQKMMEQEQASMEERLKRVENENKLKQELLESKIADLQRQVELERNRNDSLTASLMLVQTTKRSSAIEDNTKHIEQPRTPVHSSPSIQTMVVSSTRNSFDDFKIASLPRGDTRKSRLGRYLGDATSGREPSSPGSPGLATTASIRKVSTRSQTIQCTIISGYLQVDFDRLLDEHNNLSGAFGMLQTDYEERCNYIVQLEQRISLSSEELAEKSLDFERLKAELAKVSSDHYIADSLAMELRHKVADLQEEKDLLAIKLQDANITESNTVIALEKMLQEEKERYAKALHDFNALSTEYETLQRLVKELEDRHSTLQKEKDHVLESREADLRSIFDKLVLLHEAYRADYQLEPISALSGGRNMSRSESAAGIFTLIYSLNEDGVVGALKADGMGKSACTYIKSSAFNPFREQEDNGIGTCSSSKPGIQVALTKSRKSVVGETNGREAQAQTAPKKSDHVVVLDRIAVIRILDSMLKKFDLVVQNLKVINEQAIAELRAEKAHSMEVTAQYSSLSNEHSLLLERYTNESQRCETLQENQRDMAMKVEDSIILKKQLETLQENYQVALTGIAEAHSKMTEAEHEILRLSQANSNLLSMVNEQKQQITELNERTTDMLSQLQDKESELFTKTNELALVNQQVTDKTAKIVELEAQLLRIDGSESSMKRVVTEKNATLELLKENLEIVTQEKVELTAKVKDLMDKLNAVTTSFTKATRDVSRLEIDIMEQTTSLKAAEADATHAREEKEALRIRIVKMQQDNSDLASKQISFQAEIERLQLQLKTQQLDIARVTADKDSLADEYSAFKAMNTEMSKDFDSVRSELSACKARLASHGDMQREIDSLKEQLKDSEEDIKMAADEVKFIAISKEKLENEMNQLNSQIEDLKVMNGALNKQLSQLTTDYVTEQTRVTKLENSLAIANNAIKVLTEEKEELTLTVSAQTELLAQRQSLSKNLMESMTASGRSLRDQEEALESIKEEYEKELQRLGSEALRSGETTKKLIEERTQLVQELAALRAELADAKRHGQDTHLSLEQLASKHQLDMQAMMLDYDRRLQELQREKLKAESTISMHMNEISRLQFENERLMDRLSILEAQNPHSQPKTQAQAKQAAPLVHAEGFPPLASAMRLSSTGVTQSTELHWNQSQPNTLIPYQPYPTSDTPVTLSALQTKIESETNPVFSVSDSVVDLTNNTSVSGSSLPPYRPILKAHQPSHIPPPKGFQTQATTTEDIYKDFNLPSEIQSLIETYASEDESQITTSTDIIEHTDEEQPELDVTSSILPPSLIPAIGDIEVIDTVDVLNEEIDIDELVGKYT